MFQPVISIVGIVVLTAPFLGSFIGGSPLPADLPLRSVEDLIEIGFSRSRVVMINEAHSGMKRCIRTRQIGLRILPRAHAVGVRHLAMEALDPAFTEQANRTRRLPARSIAYLAQTDMRDLVRAALDLGWTLIPYEADISKMSAFDDAKSMEATNWREREQARNLAKVVEALGPDVRLLVWCGNGHLEKKPMGDWKPFASQFWQISGIEPFSIDQTLTVAFGGRTGDSRGRLLLDEFRDQLKAIPSGTMGFLREDWKEGSHRKGVDAFVISLHNALE